MLAFPNCSCRTLFLLFQAKLDLPIDKERAMRQFDDEKKWDIVCDQVGCHCLTKWSYSNLLAM